MRLSPDPSARMTISSVTFREKSRRAKRIRDPSGDHAGSESKQPFFTAGPRCGAVHRVIRRSRPVRTFTMVNAPPRERRICDPSGDQEIPDPSNASQPDESQPASRFSRLPSALIVKRDSLGGVRTPPEFPLRKANLLPSGDQVMSLKTHAVIVQLR